MLEKKNIIENNRHAIRNSSSMLFPGSIRLMICLNEKTAYAKIKQYSVPVNRKK